MKPVTPIIKGLDLPVTNMAEGQNDYMTLPVFKDTDGTCLSRWKLSRKERLLVLFTGNIYFWQMTFNQPMQPIMLECDKPKESE